MLAFPLAASAGPWPPLDSSQIKGAKLFDLGAADANDDGALDIFTINHKFESSYLLGDGAGGFTEATVPSALNPTQEFPGLEALRRTPIQNAPGLYIHATDLDQPRDPLHIDAVGIPASGRIVFGSPNLAVDQTGGAIVTTGQLPNGSATLDFEAQAGESIDISVGHIDVPMSVSIDPPTAPAQIRVGADAVPATTRQFELNLRDRHGYAFADYDGDSLTDLFIASGGFGGDIAQPFFTPLARDELLLSRFGRYVNTTSTSGLVKGDCRGRGADVADFDGDGTLDLLEACEGSFPRLWSGRGAGAFTPATPPPALGTTLRLLDLNGDRRPEVLAANGSLLQVWSNASGAWGLLQQVVMRNGDEPVDHLALGDIEGDGDLDVLAVSAGGNTILRTDRGRLRRLDPKRLGLPATARAASFVDYDNDGDLDLHQMPQGLFEAVDGRFERTRQLEYDRAGLVYAIDGWIDVNGDGRRDLLTARGRDEFAPEMTVELRRNTTRGGHWLEIDLRGPSGNRQAIGARVKVKVGDHWIYQWVGQNDDSRFSSGHYRLYFGLGEAKRAEEIVVSWPDGSKRALGKTRGDRLIRIGPRA